MIEWKCIIKLPQNEIQRKLCVCFFGTSNFGWNNNNKVIKDN